MIRNHNRMQRSPLGTASAVRLPLAGQDMGRDIVDSLATLRKFASRLTNNSATAEDLVQETALRALVHADQFQVGTNLGAWLRTIMRNLHIRESRRNLRIDVVDPGQITISDIGLNRPEWHTDMEDASRAYFALPPVQQEAIYLVSVTGNTYAAAAKLSGCPVGTLKSRVSRGRINLRRMLD